VNYSAAKARSTRHEIAAQEVASRGITVNAVAPGIIDTAMIASTFKRKTSPPGADEAGGQPSEVADLIGFLASEQAAYITARSSRSMAA